MAQGLQVKCLMLPLQSGVLLVPNAVVAEVLNDQRLREPPANAPTWQLGQIEWRDESHLKIISFEGICGEAIPPTHTNANVVVMYAIQADQKNRYYGIYTDDVPTFEFVDNFTLNLAPDQSNYADYVANSVLVNGISGYVPDLDKIARLLG